MTTLSTQQFLQQFQLTQWGDQRPPEQFWKFKPRDLDRLRMAAWGVGATHAWFRAQPRAAQALSVQDWVDQAMERAAERRAAAWQRDGYCGA